MFYIKQELNSLFIENKKSSHCEEHEPTSSSANENVLSPFPLKNEDELMLIESKLLSEDLSFTNKLVCARKYNFKLLVVNFNQYYMISV